jgi:hypothetical protein
MSTDRWMWASVSTLGSLTVGAAVARPPALPPRGAIGPRNIFQVFCV